MNCMNIREKRTEIQLEDTDWLDPPEDIFPTFPPFFVLTQRNVS